MKLRFRNNFDWKASIKYYVTSFSNKEIDLLNIDRGGRIISFISGNGTINKITYKKAFDGSWLGIKREPVKSQRERFNIPVQETKEIYEKISAFIRTLIQLLSDFNNLEITLDENDTYISYKLDDVISFWINLVKNINFDQNKEDSLRFPSIYSNIGILPPDRYGSLVVQVTIGCVYNKCVFCSLYRGIEYRHKLPAEVKQHLNEIDVFMGDSLGRFHSIFLGDANALTIPFTDLLGIFKILNEHYYFSSSKVNLIQKNKPIFEGIYSFLDVFTGFKLTTEHLKELRDLNLKMVYLGIESGSLAVLKLYDKPNSEQKILQLIQALHGAKVGVAVIFLVGAGGKMYEEDHFKSSLELIKRLDLTSKDIIYLSKLFISENSSFEKVMNQKNIAPLNENELEKQFNNFKNELNKFYNGSEFKPLITKYEILDFIY